MNVTDWIWPILATAAITSVFHALTYALTTARQLSAMSEQIKGLAKQMDERSQAQKDLCDQKHEDVNRRLLQAEVKHG